MITPQELRLGNKLSDYSGRIITVNGIKYEFLTESHFITCKENGSSYIPNEELHPIPLTEEWLIKAGFEITYSSNFRLRFDHQVNGECGYDFSHTPEKSMEGFRYYGHYIKIKYVHQLQNLYWCLCGKELEFKEI